jgi:Mg2+-importing ATPase
MQTVESFRASRVTWLSWFVGTALLAAVVLAVLHIAEAESFARLVEQAEPAWLAAALALQAATYLAQGEIWRAVMRAAGVPLSLGSAYRLSLIKLLVVQALPSSGLSGAVVVAGALRRSGVRAEMTTSGVVVTSSAYLLAYALALCESVTGLQIQMYTVLPLSL